MYRVMIVDDEPFVRKGLRSLINWESYNFSICYEADNGRDALKLAKDFRPDLIITDIKMPEMDGLELVKKCVENADIESKYIILTGFSNFEYAQRSMGYGVCNYILKPVEEEEIIETLIKLNKELDLKSEKILNTFNYVDFTTKVLERFVNGYIEQDELYKIKQFIPEFEKGEFVYVILQPIKVLNILEYYEENSYEIIKEIKRVILNITGINKALNVLSENNGLEILVSISKLNKNNMDMKSILQTIIDEILEKIRIHVIIYTGIRFIGIPSIKCSRDSCLNTINTNFILSKKGIVSYENIENIVFNYGSSSTKLFDELLESVEKNNINKIYENIEYIYENLAMHRIAPEIIKANILSFELEVIKLIVHMGGDVREVSNSFKHLKFNFMIICDVRKQLTKFCILVSGYIHTLKQTSKFGIVYEVQKYINSNYNKDIKLKDISKQFSINTIYLGQLFKKNFVTTQPLQIAKTLLLAKR
ncbi:response regulator, partial [Clostridium sp.]|uniref:response regulator n=1 Tax=Clostridium sp. TaxID=1506 RepID=UPI003FD84531